MGIQLYTKMRLLLVALVVMGLGAQSTNITTDITFSFSLPVGATKTGLQWSPICDNMDSQPRWMIGATSLTVTLVTGLDACYRYRYFTDTLIPVGPIQLKPIKWFQAPLVWHSGGVAQSVTVVGAVY